MDPETRCRREIAELHEFFGDWFSGTIERDSSAFERFEGVIAEEFHMVGIDGAETGRDALVSSIWESWNHPGEEGVDTKIETSEVRLLHSEGDLHLVTYLEHQSVDGDTNTRRTTALFRERLGTPHGLEWLHVHETPLEPGRAD